MSLKTPNLAAKCSTSFFLKAPKRPFLERSKARIEIFLSSVEIISMQNIKILNTLAEIFSKADIKY